MVKEARIEIVSTGILKQILAQYWTGGLLMKISRNSAAAADL